MSRTLFRIVASISILVFFSVLPVPTALADGPICPGFTDKGQRIERLGGRAAFSKPGVTTVEELQEQFAEHRDELAALMASQGQENLSEAVLDAVAAGRVGERDLVQGEVFEWMSFRKRSGPTTAGPVCLAAKKTYSAYTVEVEEVLSSKKADARCALRVPETGCHDQPVRVDAGGSSSGVEVSYSGPDGGKTIIAGGSTSWSGTLEELGTYSFSAKASDRGSSRVTTHSYVVPKVCLNLAYTGHSAPVERPGETDSCEETASIEIADCRPPSCSIELTPAEIARKGCTEVGVSGVWDDEGISVSLEDAKGQPAKGVDRQPIGDLSDFPAQVCIKKKGIYTFSGTATKGGDSAPCEAQLTVGSVRGAGSGAGKVGVDAGRWILRGFLASVSTDDNEIFTDGVRANGDIERTSLKLESGTGVGAGLEYLFNDRIGVEGSLLLADLDSSFFLDLNEDWQRDEDEPGFTAFTVGPNFHLTPGKAVDFFIGPFVGFADIDDASFLVLGERVTRNFDTDTLFGVQLGLDIPIADSRWGVHLGARLMDLSVEVDDTEAELGVDPFVATVGFAYRFGG